MCGWPGGGYGGYAGGYGAGLILRMFVFSEANTIMIYMMGVLLASCAASRKLCALYSALLSVILFNFFLLQSLYTA